MNKYRSLTPLRHRESNPDAAAFWNDPWMFQNDTNTLETVKICTFQGWLVLYFQPCSCHSWRWRTAWWESRHPQVVWHWFIFISFLQQGLTAWRVAETFSRIKLQDRHKEIEPLHDLLSWLLKKRWKCTRATSIKALRTYSWEGKLFVPCYWCSSGICLCVILAMCPGKTYMWRMNWEGKRKSKLNDMTMCPNFHKQIINK